MEAGLKNIPKHPYPKSIPEAAALLDKIKPDWRLRIDVKTLDMKSPHWCILGQVFGNYFNAIDLLEMPTHSVLDDGVFGSRANPLEWRKMIERKMNDFNWALNQMRAGLRVKRSIDQTTYWIDKGRFTSKLGGVVSFYYEAINATDWVLDDEVSLDTLEPGDQFTYMGQYYTRCQSFLANVYIVRDHKVSELTQKTMVKRGWN